MTPRRIGLTAAVVAAVLLAGVLLVEGAVLAALLATRSSGLPFGTKVAVVHVESVLIDPAPFVETLRGLERNDAVKAVVIRLESPGGSVAASQEMCEAVRRLRGKGKRVVASVGNVGASGAYYIASAAETIVANPGSIVGSIGVLASFLNLGDLYEKIGVDPYSVTSGRFKAVGETSRRLDPEERRLVQALIDDAFEQFFDAVVEGRRTALAAAAGSDDTRAVVAHLRRFADGRILTGRQARAAGLVDVLGTHHDAVALAGRLVGAGDEPNLIEETPGREEKGLFGRFSGAVARALGLPDLSASAPIVPAPGLYYLYLYRA